MLNSDIQRRLVMLHSQIEVLLINFIRHIELVYLTFVYFSILAREISQLLSVCLSDCLPAYLSVYQRTSLFSSILSSREYQYHCTIDLLFDWFRISCMTTDNFCFNLEKRLIQTSQTGGQWYSDTSPFSIPCVILRFALYTFFVCSRANRDRKRVKRIIETVKY